MNDILNILTKEEKAFIKQHGIDSSDIYGARGKIIKVYHEEAKMHGCSYVVANPCPYGHRLKDRSGTCIVCKPLGIAFRREKAEAVWFTLLIVASTLRWE